MFFSLKIKKFCQEKKRQKNNNNSMAMSNPNAPFLVSHYHFPLKSTKHPWGSDAFQAIFLVKKQRNAQERCSILILSQWESDQQNMVPTSKGFSLAKDRTIWGSKRVMAAMDWNTWNCKIRNFIMIQNKTVTWRFLMCTLITWILIEEKKARVFWSFLYKLFLWGH